MASSMTSPVDRSPHPSRPPSTVWIYVALALAWYAALVLPGDPSFGSSPTLNLAWGVVVTAGLVRGFRLAWAAAVFFHSFFAVVIATLAVPDLNVGALFALQLASLLVLFSGSMRRHADHRLARSLSTQGARVAIRCFWACWP